MEGDREGLKNKRGMHKKRNRDVYMELHARSGSQSACFLPFLSLLPPSLTYSNSDVLFSHT